MEEFSRRIWAPAQQGSQRETKWFYERARGQYADAQAKLTPGDQRRFKAECPKSQMFTKTDLAKFENVWDDHPRWVNFGAQKNFARYASRIGKEWSKSSDQFNEFYYKRAIARGLVFRSAEKVVSEQPWYNGGYRANIVAYAIAAINDICQRRKVMVDFMSIWDAQALTPVLSSAIAKAAEYVSGDISSPPQGISNISEWCKKEACWSRLLSGIATLEKSLPDAFWSSLVSLEEQAVEVRSARKTQKVDNGIEAQKRAISVRGDRWQTVLDTLSAKGALSPKEIGILKVAAQIPHRVPSEKQCLVLMDILDRAEAEGLIVEVVE
jgi:hypothetical protein